MKVVLIFATFLLAHTANAQSLSATPYSSAVVNEFAERLISLLRPFLISHNVDPAVIDTITANFTLNFLGSHDGSITLTDGLIMGLSTAQLTGDASLDYEFRMLNVRINAGVSEVTVISNYDLKVMGLNPTGILTANIQNLDISVSVLLDMKETTMTLQHLEVVNIGKIDIHLSGNGWLSDAFFNAVVDIVVGLFKNSIIANIISQVAVVVDEFLRSLPPILPQLPPEYRLFKV